MEVSEKISSYDAHSLLLPAYFLFSKTLCVEKCSFDEKYIRRWKKENVSTLYLASLGNFSVLPTTKANSMILCIDNSIEHLVNASLIKMKTISSIFSNCTIFLTFVWYSMPQNGSCNCWWSVSFCAITDNSCQSSLSKNIESIKIIHSELTLHLYFVCYYK